MEAVIAPEEKRITLEGEKRGVHDIAMYLAEEQVSHSAAAFFSIFSHSEECVFCHF